MIEKKCNNCNNPIKKDLITYKTKVWDEDIEIPMVEGYECSKCGHVEVDNKVEDRLKVKVLEHKLDMYAQGKIKIVLINKMKDTRQDIKIAQGKIAAALDFTEQRFGAIERNDNTPTIYLAGLISELLGVTLYDLYQFELIPMSVFLELENLDGKFNVIEGLPEIRKQYYEALDIQRDMREEANELKAKRRSLARRITTSENRLKSTNNLEYNAQIKKFKEELEQIDIEIRYYDGEEMIIPGRKRPKKVGGKLEEIANRVSDLLSQIRNLESKGNAVLKQGHCLSKDDWEHVKKLYADKL